MNDLILVCPPQLREFHGVFPGSIRWKLTNSGVIIEDDNFPQRTPGEPATVRRVWKDYGAPIEKWGGHYQVPVELIVATICTESGGRPEARRNEPGYVSDRTTPSRVSVGLMQTLISTAQSVVDEDVDAAWLADPYNSIMAGTSYIASQQYKTIFDPPLVACSYNAGGIYPQNGKKNRWKMLQFPIGSGEHCDRFVKWFNDFYYVMDVDEIESQSTFFRKGE